MISDPKVEVFRQVEFCFKKAEAFFEVSLSRPKISFDIKGQDAGRAYFPLRSARNLRNNFTKSLQTELKFNDYLLENNPEIFMETIVPHECAHLIVYELFGTKVKPHGEQWQSIMQGLFNIDAKVRHDLNVSALVNKPFIYRCACDNEGLALAKRQHHKIQKGSKYICRRCRSALSYSYTKDEPEKPLRIHKLIPCLYIYASNSSNTLLMDKEVQDRVEQGLSFILNGKRPEKIYTSSVLAKESFFNNWLRKEKLFRKYQGHYDFDISVNGSTINTSGLFNCSHVIVISEKLNAFEKEYFLMRERAGVRVRQLRITNGDRKSSCC